MQQPQNREHTQWHKATQSLGLWATLNLDTCWAKKNSKMNSYLQPEANPKPRKLKLKHLAHNGSDAHSTCI